MGEKIGQQLIEGIKMAACELGKNILIGVANSSYYIGIGVALTALLFYLCGFKKAGKWMVVSIAGYFVIQAIKAAVL